MDYYQLILEAAKRKRERDYKRLRKARIRPKTVPIRTKKS